MPADHININHPDSPGRAVDGNVYRGILERDKIALELKQLQQWHDCLVRDMTSIFTRIERGEPVELHYPDGSVYIVTGKLR